MQYVLMQKNYPVLSLEMDEYNGRVNHVQEVICPERLPVGICEQGKIPSVYEYENWWRNRAVPISRHELQKSLSVFGCQVEKLVLNNLGLSLSDQYWVKPKGNSSITWDKVNFFENVFSEDIGDVMFGRNISDIDASEFQLFSPDPSVNGFLQKRWKILNDTRCLIKGGEGFRQQPFNEVISSIISEKLQLQYVPYSLGYIKNGLPVSICPNFITKDTEFVPANALLRFSKRRANESKYEFICKCFEQFKIPNIKERFDEMIILDFLIANQDRHIGNFGAIRNVETLEFEGIAPIFDNGNSLRYDTPIEYIDTSLDVEAMPFASKHSEQLQFISDISRFDLNVLNNIDSEIDKVFADKRSTLYIGEKRPKMILDVLSQRIEMLKANSEHSTYIKPPEPKKVKPYSKNDPKTED